MATTVTFKSQNAVTVNQTTGAVTFEFSTGSQVQWDDAADIVTEFAESMNDLEFVQKLAIANRLANDPQLNSPELWDGMSFTFDSEKTAPSAICKVV